MRTAHSTWLSFCVITLLLSACKTGHVVNSTRSNATGLYCAPAVPYRYNPSFAPLQNTDSLLHTGADMPVHEILVANATGILPLLRQLKVADLDTTLSGKIKTMEIRSQIQHRLLLATTEIAGVAAELDCEGERADQLARYLDDFNSKRNTRLTVASLVTGAVTTVATALISSKGAQNTVAISGGLITAGLGVLTINPAGKKMKLQHPRNVLKDIWDTPDTSAIYSPFIWYVLNEKRFSNSGKLSLAESIKQRWKEFDLQDKGSPKEVQLFFGTGGIYTADDLHTRAAMINELQSTIRSVNQDLQSSMEYLQSTW